MVVRQNSCGCGDVDAGLNSRQPWLKQGTMGTECCGPARPSDPRRLGIAGGPTLPLGLSLQPGPTRPGPLGGALHSKGSVPTFGGAWFSPWRAQALASCNGDTLLGWGGLPTAYREEGTTNNWTTPTGYVPGHVYLLVEQLRGFSLYILSDEEVPVGRVRSPNASYCGYRVITQVDGTQVDLQVKCSGEEDAKFSLVWEIQVRRAPRMGGALEDVLDGRIRATMTVSNLYYWRPRDTQFHRYTQSRATLPGMETLERGSLWPGSAVEEFWPHGSGDLDCDGIAEMIGEQLDWAIDIMRDMDAATREARNTGYLGEDSANAAHALRLVSAHPEAATHYAEETVKVLCATLLPLACDPEPGTVDTGGTTTPTVGGA